MLCVLAFPSVRQDFVPVGQGTEHVKCTLFPDDNPRAQAGAGTALALAGTGSPPCALDKSGLLASYNQGAVSSRSRRPRRSLLWPLGLWWGTQPPSTLSPQTQEEEIGDVLQLQGLCTLGFHLPFQRSTY